MRVRVLFFGATAEETGEREVELDLDESAKARDAFRRIVSTYPNLEKHSLLFAVNQEYSTGAETIVEGDELAIFTAVSGG